VTSIAVHSPCAPAAGWIVTVCIPEIAASHTWSLCIISSTPCACWAGAAGCNLANFGFPATSSLILGLYFIVQEPSG